MQVRDIMTANPACCTPETNLHEVARMMEKNDCGCIPVVASFAGMKPVGTITDRDITIRTVAANHNPIDMKASDIMTRGIATVKPDDSVEKCFDVMEDKDIRRVLVVDERGQCCGIVAQADVVKSTANTVRTNKVIREISESSPSHNPGLSMPRTFGSRNNENYSRGLSFIGDNTLIPLLIGLGTGAALMHLLNGKHSAGQRQPVGEMNSFSYNHENRMDLTDQESFGKYVDAEQEIEKRQHDLEGRVQNLKTELKSPGIEKPRSFDREEETGINRKGRSAGQNG